jgi:DNA-binding response OmpR family regulator
MSSRHRQEQPPRGRSSRKADLRAANGNSESESRPLDDPTVFVAVREFDAPTTSLALVSVAQLSPHCELVAMIVDPTQAVETSRVVSHRDTTNQLSLDVGKGEALFDNRRVQLTRTEFYLLALLLGSDGRTFSRQELLRLVWGWEGRNTREGSVRLLVHQVRRKLGPHASRLQTVRHVGYRFVRVD